MPFEVEFADQPVRLEVGRPIPSVPVRADESGIAQVFDNLLGNARRYVEDGGVIAIEAAEHGDELRISVRDTGTGIAEEDLPHIFEQFYRAEKSRSRNYGGAGLGLAICKKIVERHGGRIWAESAPDAGTTIRFTLPIVRDDDLPMTWNLPLAPRRRCCPVGRPKASGLYAELSKNPLEEIEKY